MSRPTTPVSLVSLKCLGVDAVKITGHATWRLTFSLGVAPPLWKFSISGREMVAALYVLQLGTCEGLLLMHGVSGVAVNTRSTQGFAVTFWYWCLYFWYHVTYQFWYQVTLVLVSLSVMRQYCLWGNVLLPLYRYSHWVLSPGDPLLGIIASLKPNLRPSPPKQTNKQSKRISIPHQHRPVSWVFF